jgi:hypothetical protein
MTGLLDCPVPRNDWARGGRNGSSLSPAGQDAETGVPDAGPWEPAVEEVVAYQHLGDNWDGFGAKAPTRELLESAIGLAYIFYGKGVPPPQRVVPGVDGTVLFEWQLTDGTYAEVEIDRPLHAEVMWIEPGKPAKHWTLPTQQ